MKATEGVNDRGVKKMGECGSLECKCKLKEGVTAGEFLWARHVHKTEQLWATQEDMNDSVLFYKAVRLYECCMRACKCTQHMRSRST